MEQEHKINWVRLGITVLIVLITATAVGGGIWYAMDQSSKKQKETNEAEVASLQKQVDELKTKDTTKEATTTTVSKSNLTDKETLIALTVRQFNSSKYIPAVVVHKVEGEWALTSPVPLQKTSEGYAVPGMGGVTYLWQKVSGSWTYIGMANEAGWEDSVKTKFNVIPKTIITDEERTSI